MAESSKEPTRPKKKRRFLARLLPSTQAGYTGCLTAIVLVVLVTVAWWVFFTDPANVPWRHSMTWWRIFIVLGLVIIIPIVVFRGLRLWLEGEKSPFPEVEFAWEAGMTALKENGLSIDSIPLFLVLGSLDERQETALLEASGLNFRVHVPEGPAPLHWYANPNGIYLFCTDVGLLSALTVAADKRAVAEVSADLITPGAPAASPPPPDRASQVPPPTKPAAKPAAPARQEGSDPALGTIMLDQYIAASQPEAAGQGEAASQPEAGDTGKPIGKSSTVIPRSFSEPAAPAGQASQPGHGSVVHPQFASTASSPISTDSDAVLLSPRDVADQSQRLQYVCQLLRRARSPYCALNGIMALLPFDLIQTTARAADELQWGVKVDLMTLQRALQVRCPVTALITGMDKERGFRELVKRVGRDRAKQQRFGRRFDVRCEATASELAAFCAHLCGVFEDWVYTLFREEGALTRPGNTRLFGLLCKIRCHLMRNLEAIHSGGFGYDPQTQSEEDSVPFSGCYFAATGDSDDRRAFVKSVFGKLLDEQEDVEWTRTALVKERRYRWLAYAGFWLSGILALFLIVSFLMRG